MFPLNLPQFPSSPSMPYFIQESEVVSPSLHILLKGKCLPQNTQQSSCLSFLGLGLQPRDKMPSSSRILVLNIKHILNKLSSTSYTGGTDEEEKANNSKLYPQKPGPLFSLITGDAFKKKEKYPPQPIVEVFKIIIFYTFTLNNIFLPTTYHYITTS